MKYCLDTSVLIQSWNDVYPPASFPGLWTRIADLIDSGELDLDHGACLIHRAAGRLAGLAFNGDLVAA